MSIKLLSTDWNKVDVLDDYNIKIIFDDSFNISRSALYKIIYSKVRFRTMGLGSTYNLVLIWFQLIQQFFEKKNVFDENPDETSNLRIRFQ